MTMAQALGSIPDFVCREMGERALVRCLEDAGLTADVLNEQVYYVPEIAIDRFLGSAARYSGDGLLGLRVAPLLSVRDYGLWGDYVLAATDLGGAIYRAIRTIGIHSSQDELSLRIGSATRTLCYRYAERDDIGYRQVAIAAVGVIFSIPRHYIGETWRPVSVGLDIPASRDRTNLEEAFECPVHFDRDCIEVEIDSRHFSQPNSNVGSHRNLTVHDVQRAFAGGPPSQLADVITCLLSQNLGQSRTDLEWIAQTLCMSTRTLQRRLDAEGTNFRALHKDVRLLRAIELLKDTALSISDIALALGYATTSHFGRAFRAKFGTTPAQYRS